METVPRERERERERERKKKEDVKRLTLEVSFI